jgi:hypothetical protein
MNEDGEELKKLPMAARGSRAICQRRKREGGREAVDYRVLEAIAERRRAYEYKAGAPDHAR